MIHFGQQKEGQKFYLSFPIPFFGVLPNLIIHLASE